MLVTQQLLLYGLLPLYFAELVIFFNSCKKKTLAFVQKQPLGAVF